MKCEFCGTENREDAVYCKLCGRRTDGTVICSACGKSIDNDSVFCSYCGARVKRYSVSKEDGAKKPINGEERVTSAGKAGTLEKTLKIVSAVSLTVLAICVLTFTFFIGFKADFKGVFQTVEYLNVSSNLIDYFKSVFETAEELRNETNISSYYSTLTLLTPSLNFAIAVSTLAAVSVSVIAAAVQIFSKIFRNGKSSGGAAVFAAYVSYITGVILLRFTNAVSISEGANGIGIAYNDATIAGIVVCSVFALIGLGCKIAANWRSFAEYKRIARCAFTFAGAVAAVACLVLVSASQYKVVSGEGTVNACNGFIWVFLAQSENEIIRMSTALAKQFGTVTVFSVLSYSFVVASALCIISSLFVSYKNLGETRLKFCVAFNLLAAASALIAMIFGILAAKSLGEVMTAVSEVKYDHYEKCTATIGIFVCSAVGAAVSVAQYCFDKFGKQRKRLLGADGIEGADAAA